MTRKNTFNPNTLKKSFKEEYKIQWIDSKFIDSINDINNTTKDTLGDINSLLDHFNYNSDNDNNDNNNNNDPYHISNFGDHKIIAITEINNYLKNKLDFNPTNYMYLITNVDYSILYISINKSTPLFWYKFSAKKHLLEQFDKIYKAYNQTNYELEYNNFCRGFIGTEKMLGITIDNIENHFVLDANTEMLTWGSKWKDHPFREEYIKRDIIGRENILMTIQAMKQCDDNKYHVSVRTNYSKSIITVECYDDAFIINIQYNPIVNNAIEIINKEFDRDYPIDLPMDIIMTIINMPLASHTKLLQLRPLTSYNFLMASLVANTEEMCRDLIPLMKDIIKEHNNENIYGSDFVEMSKLFLKNLETNVTINDILKDEGIEKFIDKKLQEMRDNSYSNDKIKSDILDELNKKLIQLDINDEDIKKHLTGIINGILNDN